MLSHADVVIIGGGPVGSAFALSLRDSGLSVVILEAGAQSARDARTLALSHNSRLILERLGVWDKLTRVNAIENVHVSQRGSFGSATLRASDLGIPALGYTLNFGDLRQALDEAFAQTAITVCKGANVTRRESVSKYAVAYFTAHGKSYEISAQLIALADGNTGGDAKKHDYGSQALVTEVVAQLPPATTAYERFRARGTIALLPKRDSWALIWTMKEAHANEMLAAGDKVFLDELQKHFGERLGKFVEVRPRVTYPLVSRTSFSITEIRIARIGNSAQVLHPVMAQGLNLGLRDAFELGREISATSKEDLGSERMLARYRARRTADRFAATVATDAIVNLFSLDVAPARWASSIGLTALNSVPFAKRLFARRAIFGS
jgi:2-octaprenyl-6-methoxyphenol hydroxylase